jgi:hypothetical protein
MNGPRHAPGPGPHARGGLTAAARPTQAVTLTAAARPTQAVTLTAAARPTQALTRRTRSYASSPMANAASRSCWE